MSYIPPPAPLPPPDPPGSSVRKIRLRGEAEDGQVDRLREMAVDGHLISRPERIALWRWADEQERQRRAQSMSPSEAYHAYWEAMEPRVWLEITRAAAVGLSHVRVDDLYVYDARGAAGARLRTAPRSFILRLVRSIEAKGCRIRWKFTLFGRVFLPRGLIVVIPTDRDVLDLMLKHVDDMQQIIKEKP